MDDFFSEFKRVVVETPYHSDNEKGIKSNLLYLKQCLIDCLSRGESPYASHLFFTQFLDDAIGEERRLGIKAGFAWMKAAEHVVVYVDRGISDGMKKGILCALTNKKACHLRKLYNKDYEHFIVDSKIVDIPTLDAYISEIITTSATIE